MTEDPLAGALLRQQCQRVLGLLKRALLVAREKRFAVPFVLFTNGTTKTADGYARALGEAGFSLNEGSVLTPAVSAAELFTRRGHRRVMALGNDGLAGPLRGAGIEAVPPIPGSQVDAVLAGWYREFSMDALEAACEAVWQGARLYSCSQSVFFGSSALTEKSKLVSTG